MVGKEASTLLGAVPVGLQLWHAGEAGGPALRWANAAAGRELEPLGAQAAEAALAGQEVDGFAAVDGAGWFRVRARPVGDGGVVVSFEDETETHEIRVEAAFARPLNLGGGAPRLQAAVGVACFPADGGDVDTLLAAADRAMYARKR